MTVEGRAGALWPPRPQPATARWRNVATDVARTLGCASADDEVPSIMLRVLHQSGLLSVAVPGRYGEVGGSLVGAIAAIEAMAATCIPAALLLGDVTIGATLLLHAGTEAQKRDLLAPLAEGSVPFCVARDVEGTASAPPGMIAERDGRAWVLRGVARCPDTLGSPSHAIVLAADSADGRLASAFAVPLSHAGVTLEPGAPDRDGVASWRRLRLATHADDAMLIGQAGKTALVTALILTIRRIVTSAQLLGISGAALEEALQGIAPRPPAGPPRHSVGDAALHLAGCVADLSAARMMLYEAARVWDAGEDATTPAAMARIAAVEASGRAVRRITRFLDEESDADPLRLLRLIRNRRLLRDEAAPLDAERTLMFDAVTAASRSRTRSDRTTMNNQSTPRMPEPVGRPVEILDAAADAFTRQSYDATTLDQIGGILGVTKGSIYYHFRSKIDLFVAVYRRAMEMNIEAVAPIARQDGVPALDRLHRMAYVHSLQVMRHLSYQRVAVQRLELHLMSRATEEQRARLQEIISLRDEYEELFVGVIAEAVEAGDLPALDPRLMAKPLFGAINWTTVWYRPRPNETEADRDAIATRLADFVVAGLLGRPSGRSGTVSQASPSRTSRQGRRVRERA